MRLIDADALLMFDTWTWFDEWGNFTPAGAIVADAPTIEAVPVVRCKDCIHRYVTGDVTRYYVCDFMDAQYEDDGYCHHGEREEE